MPKRSAAPTRELARPAPLSRASSPADAACGSWIAADGSSAATAASFRPRARRRSRNFASSARGRDACSPRSRHGSAEPVDEQGALLPLVQAVRRPRGGSNTSHAGFTKSQFRAMECTER